MLLQLLSSLPLALAYQGQAPLVPARAAMGEDDFAKAVELLEGWLANEEGSGEVRALLGEALAELGHSDRAAHNYSLALERGDLDKRRTKSIERMLRKLDPLARDSDRLVEDTVEVLFDVVQKLEDGGHSERALGLAERIQPFAEEAKQKSALEVLIERLRSASEEVRLEGDEDDQEDSDRLPLVEAESEHYILECNLEPEVVERLGQTMDEVFGFYIEVYLDGNQGKANKRKATIRVHADRATMLEGWTDPDRSPGGWWSPSEWRVVCYDTRSDGRSLDDMLETLFHEASHQFMTMVTGGGSAPSWLNEGTASFFEGTRAMADGRVLWPDVAPSRLWHLTSMLTGAEGPSLSQVVSYDEAGSYPGDHYPFGWGLIYFLQEYEDPDSLEKIWRPSYAEIVRQAARGSRSPKDLFESIVLGQDNPGGIGSFADFDSLWKQWIVEEISPLHSSRGNSASHGNSDVRQERRRERLDRYRSAAGKAHGNRKAVVSEDELLDRALGEVAALRGLLEERTGRRATEAVNAASGLGPRAIGEKEPIQDATEEAELSLLEAALLEQRGSKESAAAALEEVLDLVSEGRFLLEQERREEIETRMLRLDRGNAPLRQLRLRSEGLRKRTQRLLSRYGADGDTWLLRARALAEDCARLLDDASLREQANGLRLRAIDAGRIAPRSLAVLGENWTSIFSGEEQGFEHERDRLSLSMPGRVAGRICLDLPLIPEYTVRARLSRQGETFRSSYHGMVVAGSVDGVWYSVGISGGRDLVVKRVERRAGGSTRLRNVFKQRLSQAQRDAKDLSLVVLVRADATLSIRVGESPTTAIEVSLPEPLPPRTCVGILVKDAALVLNSLRVEFLP